VSQGAEGLQCENASAPLISPRKYPATLRSSKPRAGVSVCRSHRGNRRGPRPTPCADPPAQTLVRGGDGTDGLRGSTLLHQPDRVQLTAYENAIAERWVRSVRTECLDHVFIFNERHLQKVLAEYVGYFNRWRPHRSIGQRAPCAPVPFAPHRRVQAAKIVAIPVLADLHHVYQHAA
jgi:hypothetical protein